MRCFRWSRGANNDIETNSANNEWIIQLKSAFNDADERKRGYLTKSQFCISKLPSLISESTLTPEEPSLLYDKLNFSNDNRLTWKRLVDYMIVQHQSDKNLEERSDFKIKYIKPDDSVLRLYKKQQKYLKSFYLSDTHQIVSLSNECLQFWSPESCEVTEEFSNKEFKFIDCTIMPNLQLIAIITDKRTIIYYDMKYGTGGKNYISATLKRKDLQRLTIGQSVKLIDSLKSKKIQLFHKSTCIGAHPDQNILYVGDEEGIVEVFSVIRTSIFMSDFSTERLAWFQIHDSEVSTIEYVKQFGSMVSSSYDGTIKVWDYDTNRHECRLRSLQNISGKSITKLYFDTMSNLFVFTTTTHNIGTWAMYTNSLKMIDIPPSEIRNCIVIPYNCDISYILTISSKNFVTVYFLRTLEYITSFLLKDKHFNCVPTTSQYCNNCLYLLGSYMTAWKVVSYTDDGIKPHKEKIIFAEVKGDSLYTIDETGVFIHWNMLTGEKQKIFSISPIKGQIIRDVTCNKDRIAEICADGSIRIVGIDSGLEISSIPKNQLERKTLCVKFGKIGSTKYLFAAGRSKILYMFSDLPGNKFRYLRSLTGHSEIIEKIYIIKNLFTLTIGAVKEIFLWDTKCIQIRYTIPGEPIVAIDLKGFNDIFIITDTLGNINFMSTHRHTPLESKKAFELKKDAPLSAITQFGDHIIVGNTIGYVAVYLLEHISGGYTCNFVCLCRSHIVPIMFLSVHKRSSTIVSVGQDGKVLLYSMQHRSFVGSIGTFVYWDLANRETWKCDPPVDEDNTLFTRIMSTVHQDEIDDKLSEIHKVRTSPNSPDLFHGKRINNISSLQSNDSGDAEEDEKEYIPMTLERASDIINQFVEQYSLVSAKPVVSEYLKIPEKPEPPKRIPYQTKILEYDKTQPLFNPDGNIRSIIPEKKRKHIFQHAKKSLALGNK